MLDWVNKGTTILAEGKDETYTVCLFMYGTKKGEYGAYVIDAKGEERLAYGVTLEKAQSVCQAREDKKTKNASDKTKAKSKAEAAKGETHEGERRQ